MIDAKQFWDGAAEKYAKSPIEDMEGYTHTLDRTRSYLTLNDHVLEIGCGTGSTSLILAKGVNQITASDISPNMIHIGRAKANEQKISNVKFIVADVFNKDIENKTYDAVMAFNLLHLLEDLAADISRVHGLLKPDGLFISKTICQFGAGIPLKYRIMKWILPLMQLFGKAPYVNFMDAKKLESVITAGGFKIIETGNYPTRYVVARKI